MRKIGLIYVCMLGCVIVMCIILVMKSSYHKLGKLPVEIPVYFKDENKTEQVNFEEFLTISLAKAKTINETFEYFKKVIEPIMQVSEEFSVDYNKEIPFLYFGSDTESAYGQTSSFSDFYKGIMKKLNINLDNIWTNEWSDGKYIIKFNENEEFKTYAWESIGGVIDNVELIVSKMNEKEINIDI